MHTHRHTRRKQRGHGPKSWYKKMKSSVTRNNRNGYSRYKNPIAESPPQPQKPPSPPIDPLTYSTPRKSREQNPTYLNEMRESARQSELDRQNLRATIYDNRQLAADRRHRELIKVTSPRTAPTAIAKFFKQTTPKRQSRFLNAVCSDSGVCLAYGRESTKIKDFFDGFSTFKYATDPIKMIGKPSANGFIQQIKYERENYTAYALIKSSAEKDSDNLLYEYIVGQYVNKQNQFFPCFLETYEIFLYFNDAMWQMAKDKKMTRAELRRKLSTLDEVIAHSRAKYPDVNRYEAACIHSKRLCILIQNFNNVESMQDLVKDNKHSSFFMTNILVGILFQIYGPLGALEDEFSHQDFHGHNSLCYVPRNGHYTTFIYHFADGSTVTFNSEYTVKIIDYGRCFFNDTESGINSEKVFQTICNEPMCNKNHAKCGDNAGFNILAESVPADFYGIAPRFRNKSIDLRTLVNIWNIPGKNTGSHPEIRTIMGRLLPFIQPYEYGVLENPQSGVTDITTFFDLNPHNSQRINTVNDAAIALAAITKMSYFAAEAASYYASLTKLGDLHIYLDRSQPMHMDMA